MTKWQLTRPDGPWDYPTLGFRADAGAILDGALFHPEITEPPDVFWTEYLGGSEQTGISSIPTPGDVPAAQPVDGSIGIYRRSLGTFQLVPANEFFTDPSIFASLTAAYSGFFAQVDAVPALYQAAFAELALDFESGGIELHPASGYTNVWLDAEGYIAAGITNEGQFEIANALFADGAVGYAALSEDVQSLFPVALHPASGYAMAFTDADGWISFGVTLDGEVEAPGLQAGSVADRSITLDKLATEVTDLITSGSDDSLPDTYYVEEVGSTPTRSLYSSSTRYGRRVLLTATGDPHNAVAADGRVVYTITGGALRWQPGDGSKAPGPMLPSLTDMVLFGDSFTAPGNHMRDYLAAVLTGVTVTTQGEAGTSPVEIGIKYGAIQPLVTLTGNQIPTGTGPTAAIVLDPVDGYKDVQNDAVNWVGELQAADGTWVPGTLSRPFPPPVTYPDLAFTFARTTGGSAKSLDPAGARFRSTIGPPEWGKIHVWWFGRNMLQEFGLTARGPLPTMQAMSQLLTAYAPRFVVLSVTNHPLSGGGERASNPAAYQVLMDTNAGLEREFGIRYIDVRRRLIDEGLAALGITPNAQDLIDIADDFVPVSLRGDWDMVTHGRPGLDSALDHPSEGAGKVGYNTADANNVHLTLAAYELVAGWVADYMTDTMGWF